MASASYPVVIGSYIGYEIGMEFDCKLGAKPSKVADSISDSHMWISDMPYLI